MRVRLPYKVVSRAAYEAQASRLVRIGEWNRKMHDTLAGRADTIFALQEVNRKLKLKIQELEDEVAKHDKEVGNA